MAAELARVGWAEALKDPMRTIHTVRHLYPVQVTNRAVRRLRAVRRPVFAGLNVQLVPRAATLPAGGAEAAFDGRSFSFLNQRIVWEGSDRWLPSAADALWVYNLHYFRFLWSASPAEGSQLIADWIHSNVDLRSVAWDPYPTSLRVREWIEWLLVHRGAEPSLRASMIDSVAQQTEVLRRRLEFHLMGNHLLENAITLCWSGLSFSGALATAWRQEGAALLRRELQRQVLADGSHDERSPMYQALLAESLLRLSEVATRSPHPEREQIFTEASRAGMQLVRSLAHMVHPDGEYALLNDAALGVAPPLARLIERFESGGGSQGTRVWSLPQAGYGGYRGFDGSYLVFDGGPLGPDHQPGHGHADALSFELSHRGRRLITDTGVFTYTCGATREYDRSTAAHNTLEIDGRNQSELWGSFRCARRTSRHWMSVEGQRDHVALSAGYRGPGRGQRSVRHTRRILASTRGLFFVDDVIAPGQRTAALRLHFAPGVRVRPVNKRWKLEESTGSAIGFLVSDDVEWAPATSAYHPEFGREHERASLVGRFTFRDHAAVKWHLVLR